MELDEGAPFERALSRPFSWDDVSPRGTTVSFAATAEECVAVAQLLDILAVHSLKAEFTVTPWRKSGFKVTGQITAEVEQACVVTLDPVPESISEAVQISFLPAEEIEEPSDEVEVSFDAEDPPEGIDGPTVDLGMLATEFVAVGLDPYPRKPGVEFEPFIEDDGSEDTEPSPFAALASLKDKDD